MKSFLPKAISALFLAISLLACQTSVTQENNTSIARSEMLLDSIFKYYQAEGGNLFNENYPKSSNDKVTYLASTDTVTKDKVAYLWPTSGLFSGVNALLKTTRDNKYQALLQEKIIPGLECYYDTTRTPACFQSYISEAGHSDRFYDDNIWLGIDFLETYRLTGNKKYLKQSEEIWKFLLSGNDDVLNGGIYWCEQKKESKNTCSNAPASVLALQLFETTRDSAYYQKGLELYTWTKVNLQDSDYIYFDNLKTDGRTGTNAASSQSAIQTNRQPSISDRSTKRGPCRNKLLHSTIQDTGRYRYQVLPQPGNMVRGYHDERIYRTLSAR